MQFEKLQKDMMQAMKDHDKPRKDAISTLVSATKKLAIDAGCRENIPDDMTDQAIMKEIKSVKEQIETCPDSRADLKVEYEARLKVFEEYAPKMLSAEEVEVILKEKFSDVIATGNKGQIMKAVMAELKGKADGKIINEVVAKLL
ncbi:MAG: GatB/YqeY domain-containing protein [Lachnospiraceae bacterium]|nr:GatB/YqeY domain-containing protein [Lachnospiraceae bacterium]